MDLYRKQNVIIMEGLVDVLNTSMSETVIWTSSDVFWLQQIIQRKWHSSICTKVISRSTRVWGTRSARSLGSCAVRSKFKHILHAWRGWLMLGWIHTKFSKCGRTTAPMYPLSFMTIFCILSRWQQSGQRLRWREWTDWSFGQRIDWRCLQQRRQLRLC